MRKQNKALQQRNPCHIQGLEISSRYHVLQKTKQQQQNPDITSADL